LVLTRLTSQAVSARDWWTGCSRCMRWKTGCGSARTAGLASSTPKSISVSIGSRWAVSVFIGRLLVRTGKSPGADRIAMRPHPENPVWAFARRPTDPRARHDRAAALVTAKGKAGLGRISDTVLPCLGTCLRLSENAWG
jgi:hypothetical protein